MEEAGFVWHPITELSADDLKKGDILVRDRHIEIFYDYNEKDIERALSWGSVYTELPVLKKTKKSGITLEYKGIWRLEP
ncbi:MAG: hypothetical protein NC318_13925, partial [Blautia sp.]|nr:hypothetical protein [Blautia sp.]